MLIGAAGTALLPEEKLALQEKELRGMANEFGLTVAEADPGLAGFFEGCQEEAGSHYDLFFLSTLDDVPGHIETVTGMAARMGYAPDRIGVYVQPQHQGVSQHVEFTIPADPGNPALALRLFREASEARVARGAYFSRPYGPWADLVFSRDATASRVLRVVKQIVDPKNVMNPGKLCF